MASSTKCLPVVNDATLFFRKRWAEGNCFLPSRLLHVCCPALCLLMYCLWCYGGPVYDSRPGLACSLICHSVTQQMGSHLSRTHTRACMNLLHRWRPDFKDAAEHVECYCYCLDSILWASLLHWHLWPPSSFRLFPHLVSSELRFILSSTSLCFGSYFPTSSPYNGSSPFYLPSVISSCPSSP